MAVDLGRIRRRLGRRDGSPVEYDLRPYRERLRGIAGREGEMLGLGDSRLRERSERLRDRVRSETSKGEVLEEAFALVREAARRALGERLFDEQILTALALHAGKLAEMATGEGKTLAAVPAAYLAALGGRGVHVLTFNDYLARRDAGWMGPVYRFLGLDVGFVQDGMEPAERRRAYGCDVTYLTAKEAGFDLLRSGLGRRPEDGVQRPFHFAIVDEADSILIDEARVPLVIAGRLGAPDRLPYRLAEIAAGLEAGADYAIDEYGRNLELTERGLDRAEEALGCGNLLAADNLGLLTGLHCALHAAALLRRDVDYLVRDGRIQLVDEFTGRVVRDRHWPDGLQAALEAKEGLELRPAGRVLGSITLQHFVPLYPRLAGMTATALPAAEELHRVYGLDVVVIPPHRPCVRIDHPDVVFTDREAKHLALAAEIRKVHATGRPILVGTRSVEESETLAALLRRASIPCEVLNARNDEFEAKTIAGAGAPGAVTISTNMAGRGTDIRLGGADESDRARVVALGGLYVLGTNRHESLRIDQQLRGRAGRQGDPGSSRFFVSLEDDLLVRYGIRRLIPASLYPAPQAEPLDHPIVRREVARAQRVVEGQNTEIRKTLYAYSALVEEQRKIVHRRRDDLVHGRSPSLVARRAPDLFVGLSERLGRAAVVAAEREITLYHLDRCWSEHLARLADLREGIHLVRVSGRDPLSEYLLRAAESFHELEHEVEDETVRSLEAAGGEDFDLERQGLRGPSATWTYLVNDDPFRDQLAMSLAGDVGLAAAASFFTGPLLIAWGIYNRYFRKRHPS